MHVVIFIYLGSDFFENNHILFITGEMGILNAFYGTKILFDASLDDIKEYRQ